jgi:hypothetical protein
VKNDAVYRFDPLAKVWQADPSLTAVFAWDRPYGAPCAHLRQKADVSGDLPPFPRECAFVPGNTVFIGAYPQRSAVDFSPIEWIVLDTDGSTALCIAKHCLITSGYCDPQKAYGHPKLLWYENSAARALCNQQFFADAFSEAEKARIVPKEITETQLGARCTDSVFLLSEREVSHYFPEAAQRKAMPTAYAVQTGARLGWTADTNAFTSWWLLPEEAPYGAPDGAVYPKAVFQMGEIQFHGRNAYHTDFTLRPCIQVKYTEDGSDAVSK